MSITGGNTLQVVGDDTGNNISVESGFNPACPGGGRCFWFQSETSVMIALAPCVVSEVPGKGHQAVCPPEGLNIVAMFGRGGRDTLDGVTKFLRANLHGDSGNDRLIAGYGKRDAPTRSLRGAPFEQARGIDVVERLDHRVSDLLCDP